MIEARHSAPGWWSGGARHLVAELLIPNHATLPA
jgi:hypothetical protein